MIRMPRRSVTRFFIPLIDVLILLFCVYLLMPIVQTPSDAGDPTGGNSPLTQAERRELESLRKTASAGAKARQITEGERQELYRLRRDNLLPPHERIAMRLSFSDNSILANRETLST